MTRRTIHVGPCVCEQLDNAIGNPHAGNVAPYDLLVGTERIYVDVVPTMHMSDQDIVNAVLAYWGI